MNFDWQLITVALIVAGALLYVARRGLARLRSFRGGATGVEASCATGCGKCGDEKSPAPKANVLIQIRPSHSSRSKSA